MTRKLTAAIKASIKHWERIRDGIDVSISPAQCALCQLFNTAYTPDDEDCIGCPIRERTRRRYCARTPYSRYANYIEKHGNDKGDAKRQALAQLEIDFLKSLLPQ